MKFSHINLLLHRVPVWRAGAYTSIVILTIQRAAVTFNVTLARWTEVILKKAPVAVPNFT